MVLFNRNHFKLKRLIRIRGSKDIFMWFNLIEDFKDSETFFSEKYFVQFSVLHYFLNYCLYTKKAYIEMSFVKAYNC